MKVNKNFLIDCIQACINSYEGKHGVVVPMFEKWEKHEIDNIEFYFAERQGTAWIVFRGSDEWEDWGQNMDAKSIDLHGGQMHLGFYEDNIKVQEICFKYMEKYSNIIITGHSKGADQALAVKFFADIYFKRDNKSIFCTAVAPAKCVSRTLARKFTDTISILNGEDYVTKLPQWKFTHVNPIRIGKRNFLFWIPFIRIAGAWAYHPPEDYLENMKKYTRSIV